MKKYIAEYEIVEFSRSGWDEYVDRYTQNITASSIEELGVLEEKFIKETASKYYGDFGILLKDVSCRLIRKYMSDEYPL